MDRTDTWSGGVREGRGEEGGRRVEEERREVGTHFAVMKHLWGIPNGALFSAS